MKKLLLFLLALLMAQAPSWTGSGGLSSDTGLPSVTVDRYVEYESFDFRGDESYRIDLGGTLFLNDTAPIVTMEEVQSVAEELHEVLMTAGVNGIRNGKLNYLIVIRSLRDSQIMYLFTPGENTFGGAIEVLVNASNGEILGCWPGE